MTSRRITLNLSLYLLVLIFVLTGIGTSDLVYECQKITSDSLEPLWVL